MAIKRFVRFTEADETSYDLKLFKEFLASEDERKQLLEIPAAKLATFCDKVCVYNTVDIIKKKITRQLEEMNFI